MGQVGWKSAFTPEEKDRMCREAVQRMHSGESVRGIARLFGVGNVCLHYWLKARGLPTNRAKAGVRWLGPREAAVLELAAAGKNKHEIAEALGIKPASANTVMHAARRKMQEVRANAGGSGGGQISGVGDQTRDAVAGLRGIGGRVWRNAGRTGGFGASADA